MDKDDIYIVLVAHKTDMFVHDKLDVTAPQVSRDRRRLARHILSTIIFHRNIMDNLLVARHRDLGLLRCRRTGRCVVMIRRVLEVCRCVARYLIDWAGLLEHKSFVSASSTTIASTIAPLATRIAVTADEASLLVDVSGTTLALHARGLNSISVFIQASG